MKVGLAAQQTIGKVFAGVVLLAAPALSMSVRPRREAAAVDMQARLGLEADPTIQERLADGLSIPTRDRPHVALEGLEDDQIIVRIRATPEDDREGGRLAREVLDAISSLRDGEASPRPARLAVVGARRAAPPDPTGD